MAMVRTLGKALAGATVVGGLGAAALRRQAATIAARPDPVPLEELRRDPQGATEWVERPDGTRIRTVVAGDGPTVVLSHGYGASLKEWNVVADRLVSSGRRVIALDWRGHGQTVVGADGISAPVVAADHQAVLEHFDVRDGVQVGHSTGGYVSIAMLVHHPETAERLKGLALVASLAGDASVEAPQTKLQIPLITSGAMERIAASPTLGPLFAASIYGDGMPPAAGRVFLDAFLEADHQALVPLLEGLSSTSYYDDLGAITLPTVVVCGEEDATTPRWHSERLGSDIPDASNVWVPDAGHMLNWQAPDVVIDVVEDLLAR